MSERVLDAEWYAFRHGLKPALRITVDRSQAEALVARLGPLRSSVVRANDVRLDGQLVDVIYVARNDKDARSLHLAEARSLEGDPQAHRELGTRLGFPACCVEAFCRRVARGLDVLSDGTRGHAEDYVSSRDAWVEHANPLLNCLLFRAHYRLISFYPCRFDCDVASAYARSVADVLRDVDRAGCLELVRALARPVVIHPSGARAVVFRREGVIVSAQAPHDENDHVADERDVAFATRLRGRRLNAGGTLDTEPGDAAPPLLVPFGE